MTHLVLGEDGSRSVSSKESAYFLCTTGSDASWASSGTSCQPSLSRGIPSDECITHTTGTSAARALSTSWAMLATTVSRSWPPETTSFWTSMTISAVCGRPVSVLMAARYARPPTL